MKERPILFSGPMVRAILAGRKTQTRRIVSSQLGPLHGDPVQFAPTATDPHELLFSSSEPSTDGHVMVSVAYHVGDRLWVRERVRRCTAKERRQGYPVAVFAADIAPTVIDTWPWKRDHLPSIHMPRGVCRIVLEVTEIRVQRLQDITEDDARAEGIDTSVVDPSPRGVAPIYPKQYAHARECFADLWDSINAKRAAWASNPWVWAVTFRRVP